MGNLRAREIAVQVGKQACRERGLRFLDDIIVLAKTLFKRNEEGTLFFRRIYRFEFSDTGDIILMGRKVGWLTVGEEIMQGRANVVPFQ